MKKLREFQSFDAQKFLKGKSLIAMSSKEWVEYDNEGNRTDKILGTNITVGIKEDNTIYEDNQSGYNLLEKFNVKIPKIKEFRQNEQVYVMKVTKASVFGDYNNMLSIEANDLLNAQELSKVREQQKVTN